MAETGTGTGELSGLVDLLSPSNRADPYTGYARLREQAPVWEAAPGFFVLSRYADCARVLRDGRFGHLEGDEAELRRRRARRTAFLETDDDGHDADDGDAEGGGANRARDDMPVRSFLMLNPPDHTRLRRLVSRSFTPRRVEELGPRIEELTAELLDRVPAEGPFDVVESLASPLPVAVISELFGVPEDDRALLVQWSHALARTIEPEFLLSADERRTQVMAREEFASYLFAEIASRRRAPRNDLVSDLVAVHDSGDSLSEPEIVATCILLLIAGHETTTSLIGNGLYALLRNRAQYEDLVRHPELAPGAVEEVLRFDSPVQLTMRVALEDGEAAGVDTPKGTFVLLLIGAANRDPLAYEDPDRLDIRRPPAQHLAFGQGIHFCLGAPLARLEAQIALRALVRRFGGLRLVSEPSWKENAVLRGLRQLEIEAGP